MVHTFAVASLQLATLNFRRTKSSSGPSSLKEKAGKVKVTAKKTSSLKETIKTSASESIDSFTSTSSDEEDVDEPDVPLGAGAGASASTLKKAEEKVAEEKVERKPLNLSKYSKLYGISRAQANGLPFIHSEKLNKAHHILRTFDLSYQYGPCIGMTRMERWTRAHEMGLNPPMEIKEILESKQGVEEDSYKQSVFYGEV